MDKHLNRMRDMIQRKKNNGTLQIAANVKCKGDVERYISGCLSWGRMLDKREAQPYG